MEFSLNLQPLHIPVQIGVLSERGDTDHPPKEQHLKKSKDLRGLCEDRACTLISSPRGVPAASSISAFPTHEELLAISNVMLSNRRFVVGRDGQLALGHPSRKRNFEKHSSCQLPFLFTKSPKPLLATPSS